MKNKVLSHSLIGLMAVIYPVLIQAQNTSISGSTFNTGFGVATGTNTAVTSATGEVLIGPSEGDNTTTESGFLVVVRRQQEAILGLDVPIALPEAFALHQNYPNPFNPTTTIRFDLPVATDIDIVVYDVMGREVVRLLNRHVESGSHELIWNGRDRSGRRIPSGMYIILMATPEFTKTIKMVLLK